jgi:hypothetical protein
MRKSVVVSYTVRPDAHAEHVRLIEGVFAQLRAQHPDTVDYQVMCLADGVSFVHVSTHDTADGTNPLPALPAFQDFSRDAGARVSTPPTPAEATTIGAYRGLSQPSMEA